MDAIEVRSADGGGQENTEQQQQADGLDEIRGAVESLTTSVETRAGQLDASLAEMRGRLERAETALRRPGTAGLDTRQQAGELETRAFASFLRRGRELMSAEEVRVLRVSDDTDGGYLAPEQFIAEIQRDLVQFSPVRSVARVTPISAGAAVMPRRVSGFTAHWVGEIEPRPETTAKFGQARFEVKEIACWVDVSNALLEDSAFNITAEVAFEFAEEFGRAEGEAFVLGNGALEPTGFLTDTTVPVLNSGHATGLGSGGADVLLDLYGALPTPYRGNAVWAMNSNTMGALRKLKDTTGAYILAPAGINGAPSTTILGRPVVEMPDMPDIGAGAVPIVFGDFLRGYRIFDRIALSVLRDPYTQATRGITRFHGKRRVGAGVGRPDALRKLRIAV